MVNLLFLITWFYIIRDKKHNDYVKNIKRVNIRLPNDTEYIETLIDFNLFQIKNDFDTEIFGEYKNSCIFVKKSDVTWKKN